MPSQSPRRPGAFTRFMDRIHKHPQARLLEFMVWGVPGLLLVIGAFLMNALKGWAAPALISGVVGLTLVGWGAMPPVPKPEPEPENARRRSKRRG